MNFETPNFTPAIPELFMLGMTCLTLLADLFAGKFRAIMTYGLVQLALMGSALLTIVFFPQSFTLTFSGSFVLDPLACLLKLFIYITSFFTFLYSRDYVLKREIPYGDYYVLGLFSVLGMMVLVSAYSLLTLFLGLELMSLPLYTMIALRRDSANAAEGAMKYFVMGALASSMLLYGMSMIYGATQTLAINDIVHIIKSSHTEHSLVLVFGLVFLVAGTVFKIGAAPFHMWVPDAYQGAPTSVTLFLSAAPKIAALGLAIRLFINAMPDLVMQWRELLILVAILSMSLGNFVAIVQSNIKRMLAYSAIAHMGYMSLGLLAGTPDGYGAATFYMIAYAIMSLGAFGILVMLSRVGLEAENIADLRGLNTRDPWLAFMMLLIMFSMAGIPPTVGFFAKLGVLEALISVHLVWLAVLALLFAIVGAYYYIAVVKVMYFEEPEKSAPITIAFDNRLAITINGLAVLLLGIFPSFLIDFCRQVFQ